MPTMDLRCGLRRFNLRISIDFTQLWWRQTLDSLKLHVFWESYGIFFNYFVYHCLSVVITLET